MTRSRPIVLMCICVLLTAQAAAAQTVRGTIREAGTGLTISGAVVWLTDSTDALLARSISGADGQFAIVRLAATARLHVLHIGFRPAQIGLDRKDPDPVVDVLMAPLPLTLDPVKSSSRRVCPGDKGTSQALDLWEQARSALLASVVAREASPPRLRITSFSRSFEPIAHTLTEQVIRSRDIVGARSYVAGRSPWEFSEAGYLREGRDGSRVFYAPDDGVMLDPTFADTHCMRVVHGEGSRQNEIGLGFEPVLDHGRDTLVDVAGVLWLDRASNALRSVEFHYVGLEPAARSSGGEIFFSIMPNGAPMIDHWILHFAALVEDIPLHPSVLRRRKPPRSRRDNVSIRAFRETGGAVAVAQWPDGTVWRSPFLSAVRGQLMQLNGEPAAGALVWLQDGPDTTTTNANGYFAIGNVLPGDYNVRGADSVFARVGFSRVWGQIHVTASRPSPRPSLFFYYSSGAVLKLACHGQDVPAGTGLVLGRVVDDDGNAVPSARVEAVWGPPAAKHKTAMKPARSTDADIDGRFAICGVPAGSSVHLDVNSEAGRAAADTMWSDGVATIIIVVH